MRKTMFVGIVSILLVSGIAMAQQSGEQEKGSSMQEMMGSESGMGGMMGMMRMMGQMSKMMDQCIATHESMHGESGQAGEDQKK